jgi:FkbM family methyltransferase
MGSTVLRFRKLVSGIANPVYRNALRHGVGASIEHGPAFKDLDFDCILDVGANRGQFALFARSRYPAARVISFEPLPRAAAKFDLVFANDPDVKLIRAAVSRERGTLTMHVTEHDDSSSALSLGNAQREIFNSREVEQCTVRCGPLGDFIAEDDLGRRNLLKIDVQGFELEVLRGAEGMLGRFAAIYCELSFVELYVGQALAKEITDFLAGHGYRSAGIYNTTLGEDGQPVQADALFIR